MTKLFAKTWSHSLEEFSRWLHSNYSPAIKVFRVTYMFFFVFCFYKHMKFRNQARLSLATYEFETHIMLSFSRYRTNRYGKNLTPMWLQSVISFE